jgi:hypothetical protein
LRYQFIAPKRPWIGIVGYGYADNTTEISGISEPQETDEKFTSYSVGIGRYVGPRTSVIAEYGRSHRDTDLRPPIGIGGLDSLTLSVRHETLTVGVHSLLELGTRRHLGLTAALHETAATSFPDDPIGSYEVGVTYYPRTDISVALSATGEYRTDTNSGDIHGYMLEGRWFITESVAVGLRYETTDFRLRFADSFGFLSTTESNSDGFRFNVSWRY